MTDLAAWLLEQIEADEQVARDGALPYSLMSEGNVHVARWSPARVLAECEAKRRIVEGLDYLVHYDSGGEAAINAEQFLRLLAQPYANRPGFREEWQLATRAGADA